MIMPTDRHASIPVHSSRYRAAQRAMPWPRSKSTRSIFARPFPNGASQRIARVLLTHPITPPLSSRRHRCGTRAL